MWVTGKRARLRSWACSAIATVATGLFCSTAALADQVAEREEWTAAYKEQVKQTHSLRRDLNEARAMLDALEKPIGSLEEITALISKEARKKSALQMEIIELETALEMPNPADDVQDQLDAARYALAIQHEQLLMAAAQKEVAATYSFMQSLVAASEAEFLASQNKSRQILAEHSDRKLTSNGVALLHKDLGLPLPSEG